MESNYYGCNFEELSEYERRIMPWLDPDLPWSQRVEKFRIKLQEEVCTKVGGTEFTRVVLYEEADRQLRDIVMPEHQGEKDKERLQDFHIQELQASFASMNGILFGNNGNNGAIQQIQQGQEKILSEIAANRSEMSNFIIAQEKKNAQIEMQVQQNKRDIDGVGKITRELRDRPRAMLKTALAALITIGTGGLTTLLILGVRSWLESGGP